MALPSGHVSSNTSSVKIDSQVKMKREQKITFAEMRAAGVRGLLIYCSDFRCSHHTAISGDRWPDDVRLSDRPRFTCQACGRRGADVRPDWQSVDEYA
jgi:hypothetical protein